MKVLLLRPSSNIRVNNLPLGLMYVAAYLEQNNHKVRIVDLKLSEHTEQAMKKSLQDFKPDFVGIGCMTVEYNYVHEMLKQIKEEVPEAKVIMGGPHVNAFHDVLKNEFVDIIVLGEGEITMQEIVDGKKLSKINGIGYKENGHIKYNPPRDFIDDLDNLPFPAYHLVDMEQYFESPFTHGFVLANKRRAQIFTSRGCPYNCNYCHKIFGKKFRKRSPENVLKEIKFLHDKYGVKEFHFEDDSFNVDIKRAKRIMDLIIQSGMKIKINFPNGIRGDMVDEELLRKMKRAGTYHFCLGIESWNPEIQTKIGKHLNLKKLDNTINMATRLGIIVGGFFMIGFVGETKKEMKQTIDYAVRSKLHTAIFSKVTPFKGTRLFDEAVETGYKPTDNLEELDYRFGKANVSAVSDDELDKLHKNAYLRFYFKPSRMWNLFKVFPDKLTLVKQALRLLLWKE